MLGMLIVAACGPDDEDLPLPEMVWEGNALRVRMQDPTMEVCGGTFEALNRHAELVREVLLLEGDGLVEYSVVDADFVDAACVPLEDPRACAEPSTGRIYTSSLLDQHEIVHAVRFLDPKLSVRSPAIEEGLATHFGSDDLGEQTYPLEVMAILDAPHVGGLEDYFRAGHTMAMLLDRHQLPAFRDFDVASTAKDEELAFAETFGESRAEFASVAEGEPVCEQSQWWVPLLECDGEPITADPSTDQLVLSGDLSCAAADVKGPRANRIWTSRHFRLDRQTSELGYRFDMPEDAMLEVVSCEGGCPERFAYRGSHSAVSSVRNGLPALEPGDYFIRIYRPLANEGGDFEIVLQ